MQPLDRNQGQKLGVFEDALRGFLERVREDRTVLAVVRLGSLDEALIWRMDEISLWLIEIDGVTRRLRSDGDDERIWQKTIAHKIGVLCDLGLGYLRLGHPATILSGGEAQRVKLAGELGKLKRGKHNLYILDEPTTGLHFADIHRLLDSLDRLVDSGHSVVVIEHNLDVIKTADHVIDLGPEGGHKGGKLLATGTPEQIARTKASHTGRFLKALLRA